MCTTSNHASKFDFPASRHAHEFQPHKLQLLEADLHDLFSYIWACDIYSYNHPCCRLQVTFSRLLIFHLGLHPNVTLKEGLRTWLVGSWHFSPLITSVSYTELIGKPSSTFASSQKHAAMSLSTCSSAALRSIIGPLLKSVIKNVREA